MHNYQPLPLVLFPPTIGPLLRTYEDGNTGRLTRQPQMYALSRAAGGEYRNSCRYGWFWTVKLGILIIFNILDFFDWVFGPGRAWKMILSLGATF